MNPSLLNHEVLWAAAGAPNAAFSAAPRRHHETVAAALLPEEACA